MPGADVHFHMYIQQAESFFEDPRLFASATNKRFSNESADSNCSQYSITVFIFDN